MKKLFLMMALVAGLGLFANAQDKAPKTPALKAAKQTKALTKQLNLTNAQITKVNAVLLERAKGLDSLKALGNLADKKEKKYNHKLVHDETDAKLQAILTPAQKTKYLAIVDAKKQKKMAKKKADAAPAPQN